MMMASFHDSDSPQYFVFQPLPDGLSDRQRDKRLQDILVADLRSAFVLIAELQKTITELQLQGIETAMSRRQRLSSRRARLHTRRSRCARSQMQTCILNIRRLRARARICRWACLLPAMSAPLSWLCTSSPLRAGPPDVAGSPSRRPQLQAPTSEVMCQTKRWPRRPPVTGRPRKVLAPPVRQEAGLHAAGAPVPPACPAPIPVSVLVSARDGVPHGSSSVKPGRAHCDDGPGCTWTCLKDCGFRCSSYTAVKLRL